MKKYCEVMGCKKEVTTSVFSALLKCRIWLCEEHGSKWKKAMKKERV